MSFACRPNRDSANLTGNYNGVVVSSVRSGQSTNSSVTFNADGTLSYTFGPGTDNSTGFPASWYVPTATGIGGSYTVKFTVNSGTTPVGTVGSFVSFPQTWSFSTTPGQLKTCGATIAIGDVSGTFTLETGNITLTSDSS